MSGGFRQVGERLIHTGHVFRLVKATYEAPDGSTFDRDIVHHPGAVGVVALDGDDVVLVRQYRPAIGAPLLELPAGVCDVAGEDPAATAARELAEEAGVTASHYEHLVGYWVAVGMSDERIELYLATGLTFGDRAGHGPEEAHMTVERVPLADAPRLIAAGEIADAKTIIGLLLAQQRPRR